MSKILILAEGEKFETSFFERYKEIMALDNIEIVSFNQNIEVLYKYAKEFIFDGIKPDNIIDILSSASTISQMDKERLNDKFTDVYLVFDLDIQNSKGNVEKYFKKIDDLIDFFDNSTTIGQLLINYPMMESIYHKNDEETNDQFDIKISSSCEFSKNYKRYIDKNKMTFDITKLNRMEYIELVKLNLIRANYITNSIKKLPSSNQYENITTKNIFEKQKNNILCDNIMNVINTAIFIDVDMFGKKYFIKER